MNFKIKSIKFTWPPYAPDTTSSKFNMDDFLNESLETTTYRCLILRESRLNFAILFQFKIAIAGKLLTTWTEITSLENNFWNTAEWEKLKMF